MERRTERRSRAVSMRLREQTASTNAKAARKKSRAMSHNTAIIDSAAASSKEPPACCQGCGVYLEIRNLPKELPEWVAEFKEKNRSHIESRKLELNEIYRQILANSAVTSSGLSSPAHSVASSSQQSPWQKKIRAVSTSTNFSSMGTLTPEGSPTSISSPARTTRSVAFGAAWTDDEDEMLTIRSDELDDDVRLFIEEEDQQAIEEEDLLLDDDLDMVPSQISTQSSLSDAPPLPVLSSQLLEKQQQLQMQQDRIRLDSGNISSTNSGPKAPSSLDGSVIDSEEIVPGYTVEEEFWENEGSQRTGGSWELLSYSNYTGSLAAKSRRAVVKGPKHPEKWEYLSKWRVDKAWPGCENDGWIYSDSLEDFLRIEREAEAEGYNEQSLQPGMDFTALPRTRSERSVASSSSATSGGNGRQAKPFRRRRWARKRRFFGEPLPWIAEISRLGFMLTGVDHPLCLMCQTKVIQKLDSDIIQAENERDVYQKLIQENNEATKESPPRSPRCPQSPKKSPRRWERDELPAEHLLETLTLEELHEEERRMKQLIEDCESKRNHVQFQREKFRAFATEVSRLQVETMQQSHARELYAWRFQEDERSINAMVEHIQTQLRELHRFHVISDAFFIWYDGPFATINGLRLGRLSTVVVDWPEINAALGQTAMLLSTMVKRSNVQLQKYRIHPFGSFPQIKEVAKNNSMPLFYESMFRKKRFNGALKALLEIVQELGSIAVAEDRTLRIPFPIHKDKIGGESVTYSSGNEEGWTRAMKYLMIHLKWLSSWIVRHYPFHITGAD